MIVAGEASGDAHAAALVRALCEAKPEAELNFFGATGPLLREAGVETIVASDELAILGLLEIGRALPKFWRAYKLLKQAAIERQADAVILVDWPDFNLKLARVASPPRSKSNLLHQPAALGLALLSRAQHRTRR